MSCFGSEACFAIGSHWDMYGENLRMAMHLADEDMYKDKGSFYEQHKEFRSKNLKINCKRNSKW